MALPRDSSLLDCILASAITVIDEIIQTNIACIVVGFCIPLVPTIALIAEYASTETENEVYQLMNITFPSGNPGFLYGHFPPMMCIPSNENISVYAVVLPL